MPVKKWTRKQRAKFKQTMAARRAGKVKRSSPVKLQDDPSIAEGDTVHILQKGRMHSFQAKKVLALFPK